MTLIWSNLVFGIKNGSVEKQTHVTVVFHCFGHILFILTLFFTVKYGLEGICMLFAMGQKYDFFKNQLKKVSRVCLESGMSRPICDFFQMGWWQYVMTLEIGFYFVARPLILDQYF